MTFAGDDDVLELLSRNVAANAPKGVARVEKLVWAGRPTRRDRSRYAPDLLLASDVVYGNDPVKWRQLVKTMRDLSGPRTLVVVGNVQRYPVHHPMAETRFFEEATAEDFIRREVPTTGCTRISGEREEEAAWCTCFEGDPNRSSAREGNPRGTRRRLASARGSARGRRSPGRGRRRRRRRRNRRETAGGRTNPRVAKEWAPRPIDNSPSVFCDGKLRAARRRRARGRASPSSDDLRYLGRMNFGTLWMNFGTLWISSGHQRAHRSPEKWWAPHPSAPPRVHPRWVPVGGVAVAGEEAVDEAEEAGTRTTTTTAAAAEAVAGNLLCRPE